MSKARPKHDRIHSLEIPLAGLSLLLPSAAIAEVTNYVELSRVPGSPAWALGAFGWRAHAVPVFSFEALLGGTVQAPGAGSKIVVFYPLPGQRPTDFFALVSAAEPRPQAIDTQTAVAAAADELPDSPYLGAGLKLDGRVLAIPDLVALKAKLYPKPAG